jgi:hypothetical protein
MAMKLDTHMNAQMMIAHLKSGLIETVLLPVFLGINR